MPPVRSFLVLISGDVIFHNFVELDSTLSEKNFLCDFPFI